MKEEERMHARIITSLLCCTALFILSGCGIFKGADPSEATTRPDMDVALTSHNPVSLQNYRTARTYSAEGRFELAREHYLLAYAAAEGDAVLRVTLERELRAIDMMIKTLR